MVTCYVYRCITKIVQIKQYMGGKERNKMQKNTPNKRKKIRLKEYDYSTPGYYFVTICTQNRKEILSKIINSNKENVGAGPTIPRIINSYKSIITRQIGYLIWQRNYYEHIIRNEKEYYKIVEYIENNPLKWEEDEYFN